MKDHELKSVDVMVTIGPTLETDKHQTGEARRRIAVNVRRLRMERGLSQEGMAELADFHRTYVSQLERRVTNISIDGLERLAMALDVDITELLKD